MIAPGCEGSDATVTERTALVPQEFFAATEMVPELNGTGNATEMELLPSPVSNEAPSGNVHS